MRPAVAAGAVGATNVAIAALTLVNGVLMARMLGPQGRGSLFAMLAFPTAAAALAGAFVQPALARRAAAGTRGAVPLEALALAAALPLGAVGALLAVLLLLVAGAQLEAGEKKAAAVFAVLWTPVSLAILNLLALDLGRARWRRYNALRALLYPVMLVGLTAMVLRGGASTAAVLGLLLLANAAVLAARATLAAREGRLGWATASEVRALYREALPFLGASVAGAALVNADQLVAAVVLGEAQAGFYAVAQRAGALLAPLASAAGVVAFSRAAQPSGIVPGPSWERRAGVALAGVALVLAPLVWYLVPVVFGRDFEPARGAAAAALAAGLAAAVTELREQRLEGGGLPLSNVPGRLAGALVLAAVAVPAGARYGPVGVVAGSLAGHSVRALVLGRVLARGERR
jgi:O-antigen/teichoic acid export membrane protein